MVSLYEGRVYVQRGVYLKADMPEEAEKSSSITMSFTSRQPDAAEGIRVPLLTKMSSERTLAVQAALMQQPEKAVVLMVWRMYTYVFSGCVTTTHPFRISLTVSHSLLTENAPSDKSGAAYDTCLKPLLPAGWEKDFTLFFDLNGEVPVPSTVSIAVITDAPLGAPLILSRRQSDSTCVTGGSRRRITTSAA